MITQATISIIGVMLILMTAWGYYATKGRTLKGRGVYAFILAIALIHMVADGCLRATSGAPEILNWSELAGTQRFYLILYLIGLVGVLQAAFDLVWSGTHESESRGKWIAFHIPAIVIVIVTVILGDTLMTVMLKYMPLLYALFLFFFAVWYYEKLDRGIRIGLLAAMVGSVLIFIGNSVLKITYIPLLVLVLFVVLACSLEGNEPAEEEEEIPSRTGADRKERTVFVAEAKKAEEEEDIELSELEKMMQESRAGSVEKLVLDSGEESEEVPQEEESEPVTKPEPAVVKPDNPMTIASRLQQRPLILEKDLNEYYHHMREAVENRDHDRCLEILSEMSEYRISGIYLTRYERIRHAILDEDWATVEKELMTF